MPTITATATLENDISFTLIKLGSNQQNESASLNYDVTLTTNSVQSGLRTGLYIDYGVVSSGTIPSGGSVYFDMQAFPKEVLGTTGIVSFNVLKGIAVYNRETSRFYDMTIQATGSNTLSELWNGGTGNNVIKPYAVWQYADPLL